MIVDFDLALDEWRSRCLGGPTGWKLSALALAVMFLVVFFGGTP